MDAPWLTNGLKPQTVRITYTPGRLAVYLDDTSRPLLTARLMLEDTIDLTDGTAWIGLTAATGGLTAQQDVWPLMWSSP
jgi:hypothetical protein